MNIKEISLEQFKSEFRYNYSYIHHELSDEQILEFLFQDYIWGRSLSVAMDLFSDYLQANQLCEVSM